MILFCFNQILNTNPSIMYQAFGKQQIEMKKNSTTQLAYLRIYPTDGLGLYSALGLTRCLGNV